jgi:hypothetical protein
MARRSELNQELAKRLCAILADANTIGTACAACGITDRTFHNWMKRGEEEKRGPFFQFLQSATRARATARMKLVKIISDAAPRDWKAAAWQLERQYPEEFGRCTPREPLQEESKPQAPQLHTIHMHSEHSDIARGIMYGDPEAKELMRKYEDLQRRLPELEAKLAQERAR